MIRTALVVAALLVGAGAAPAQDVRWRTDYAAARKDAAAAGRPMLLDFAADWCGPCKRMEATTFRDPAVVAAVAAKVIPVRVDADRDAWLVKAAGIQAFPTLVLLSADGKVIARREGFADAATVTAFLQQAPAARPVAVAPPVQPAVAYQPAALPAPVQPAAAVAPVSPTGELLATARADFAAGRYLACIERCDRITTGPDAAEARQLAAAVTSDPEKWRRVIDQLEADLSAARRGLPIPAR